MVSGCSNSSAKYSALKIKHDSVTCPTVHNYFWATFFIGYITHCADMIVLSCDSQMDAARTIFSTFFHVDSQAPAACDMTSNFHWHYLIPIRAWYEFTALSFLFYA